MEGILALHWGWDFLDLMAGTEWKLLKQLLELDVCLFGSFGLYFCTPLVEPVWNPHVLMFIISA